MILNKISIKAIRAKLKREVKIATGGIRAQMPVYIEFLTTLAGIGRNLSLDIDKGLIKIREDLINDYLKRVPPENRGLKSIRISCNEYGASFFVEIKKFLLEGTIEIPFTVENFIFSKEKKSITIRFGDKKVDKVKNYYSKIAFWFVASILNVFFRKGEQLTGNPVFQDYLVLNRDGTYTMDLNRIEELKTLFNKDLINLKYWDFISIDKLTFEEKVVVLRLLRNRAAIIKMTLGFIEILPVGRLIKPLLNRF